MSEAVAIARDQIWKARKGELRVRVRSRYPGGWRVENLNGVKPPSRVVSEHTLRNGFSLTETNDAG